MADRATKLKTASPPSLLARMRAWFGRAAASSDSLEPPSAPSDQQSGKPQIAPLDRMTVAQWLWGPGFVMPGGKDYVLELAKPFGLGPAMSMLDLSAGLGGPARVIAEEFETYVTGLERSPERARRGMEMSVVANLAKRATVAQYNPESLELRPRSFDCILGRGATYNVAEKERLFRVLFQSFKARGQLLLNEFTINRALADHPTLAAWAARKSHPPVLWTIEQCKDCLTSLGFDVRIVEDVTADYSAMIVAGWAELIKKVDLKGMPRQHLVTIVDEVELWMRRVAALQSGALKVYRVYALAHKSG